MLAWWNYQLTRSDGRCWIADPPRPLVRICDGKGTNLNSQLRQLHDGWGYCAKGTLARGGLCAGTIYRTSAFIARPQLERNGVRAARGGTVHVEHTVPIASLVHQIAGMDEQTRGDVPHMLAWLLRHSVTCAFERGQEHFRTPFTTSTNAFDPNVAAEFDRPFARYQHLRDGPIKVWNVWTGELIDIKDFRFREHITTVREMLAHLEASPTMLDLLSA